MGNLYVTLRYGTLAAVLTFLLGGSLQAQDARFAQFYAAPQQVNPALTGVFPGSFRFGVNYRELYASILGNESYRTISASADWRMPINRSDFAALGFTALRDQVGTSRFSRTQGALSGAYLKQLAGGGRRGVDQFLVVGGQLGFGQRGFDWEKLWFSEQFFVDPDSRRAFIDYGMDSGEQFATDQTDLYLDANVGLLWYLVQGTERSFYVGGAIFHLNRPNISFTDDQTELLYRKFVGHLGGQLPLGNSDFSLLPAAAVMSQGPAFSASGGANIRYAYGARNRRASDEIALRAGIWAHASNRVSSTSLDAIILSTTLELNRWQLGFSYDLTVSRLTQSNQARGAFEVSLIYVQPPTRRKQAVICPNF